MIYGVRCAPLLKKLRMFRTRIGGTEIDARVRSKGCDRQRPGTAGGRLLNILYDANAGYQQTPLSVVTRPAKKPDSGHTDTISIAVLAGRSRWNAMKPRMQCVLAP
jgi:hypothetical protein